MENKDTIYEQTEMPTPEDVFHSCMEKYIKNRQLPKEQLETIYKKAFLKLQTELIKKGFAYVVVRMEGNLCIWDDPEGRQLVDYGTVLLKENYELIKQNILSCNTEGLEKICESLQEKFLEKWFPYAMKNAVRVSAS